MKQEYNSQINYINRYFLIIFIYALRLMILFISKMHFTFSVRDKIINWRWCLGTETMILITYSTRDVIWDVWLLLTTLLLILCSNSTDEETETFSLCRAMKCFVTCEGAYCSFSGNVTGMNVRNALQVRINAEVWRPHYHNSKINNPSMLVVMSRWTTFTCREVHLRKVHFMVLRMFSGNKEC